MGPSKPTMSDATFAFATQLYRNEAKALQTQVLSDFCSSAELVLICDRYKKDGYDLLLRQPTSGCQIFILVFMMLSCIILTLSFCKAIDQKLRLNIIYLSVVI